jgi:hypothetical protein
MNSKSSVINVDFHSFPFKVNKNINTYFKCLLNDAQKNSRNKEEFVIIYDNFYSFIKSSKLSLFPTIIILIFFLFPFFFTSLNCKHFCISFSETSTFSLRHKRQKKYFISIVRSQLHDFFPLFLKIVWNWTFYYIFSFNNQINNIIRRLTRLSISIKNVYSFIKSYIIQ